MNVELYTIILYSFIGVALITFIALFFFTAPYGRHTAQGWGPLINNTAGWIIMEAPASLLFLFYFITATREISITLIVLFIIWQIHYVHRAFIFPLQIRGSSKMPISIMGSAIIFNIINTFIQGEWLFHLSPLTMYANEWLKDPRFISGLCIFAVGYYINKQSDNILRNLRKPGETGYKIPEGGMYRFISCPNYFGELLEWIGWAFMTWSPAGIFFVIWTAANLLPRARSNHKWYLEKFPSYPTERKAVIPFVF